MIAHRRANMPKSRNARMANPISTATAEPRRRRGTWLIVSSALVGISIGLAAVGVWRGWFWRSTTGEHLGLPGVNSTTPPHAAPAGMAWIPGGTFWMGSKDFPDAQPLHKVYVDGFWMDKTEVTNARFREFIDEARYVTVAEKAPDLAEIM